MNNSVLELQKSCTSCGEYKPLDAFWRDGRRSALANRQSRYSNCIECSEKKFRKQHDIFPDSAEEMKVTKNCRICKIEKPLYSFRKTRHSPMGRSNDCKECYNEYRYGSTENKIKNRNKQRKFKHDLTAEEFKIMFDSQNGKCGVCETDMDFLAKSTCVDHDHQTGLIREILCQKCNLGLGHFSDNIKNMRKAVAYLEKHSSKEN